MGPRLSVSVRFMELSGKRFSQFRLWKPFAGSLADGGSVHVLLVGLPACLGRAQPAQCSAHRHACAIGPTQHAVKMAEPLSGVGVEGAQAWVSSMQLLRGESQVDPFVMAVQVPRGHRCLVALLDQYRGVEVQQCSAKPQGVFR
ncbi:hypothetical protein D3C85_890250 [compost metagenome]